MSQQFSEYKPVEMLIALGAMYAAVMSWNEVVRGLVELLPNPANKLFGQLFYAVVVTILTVILLQFFTDREKENTESS